MREKNNFILVNIGKLNVYILYFQCQCNPDSIAPLWEELPEECQPITVIVGLPEHPPSPCTTAVTLIHSIESRSRGSRVRKLPIIFLMEYYGVKQVRDVVYRIRKVESVIIASFEKKCLQVAAEILTGSVKPTLSQVKDSCNPEELFKIVSRGILLGPRLE